MKRLKGYDTSVAEDVANNPILKRKLEQAEKNIQEGNYYTSAQVRELIKQGKL